MITISCFVMKQVFLHIIKRREWNVFLKGKAGSGESGDYNLYMSL